MPTAPYFVTRDALVVDATGVVIAAVPEKDGAAAEQAIAELIRDALNSYAGNLVEAAPCEIWLSASSGSGAVRYVQADTPAPPREP